MKIYLIGIGMGNNDTLTNKAQQIIDNADLIIGAERMTALANSKQVFNSYKADEIAEYIKGCCADIIAVLLSGDIGFYSGAKRLLEALGGYDVEFVPGISSLVYFCAVLKTGWDDVKILSLHGRDANAVNYIKRYNKVFMLLSGNEDLKELCQKLNYYNMGNVILNIGQNLTYDNQIIITKAAKEIRDFNFGNLLVVLAQNSEAEDLSFGSIADDEFIRGDVPMTKAEVRSVSIAKLRLKPNSVLYDIGAGTGSVSIEAALRLIDGSVYAIEKNEAALKLIEENKAKFAVDNITIVKGVAPKAMERLPKPTHIFIGGSGGNIADIIEKAYAINPDVCIVINIIALNSLCEIMKIIENKNIEAEIVSINISRDRAVAGYRLMQAQNPVYVITLKGGVKNGG